MNLGAWPEGRFDVVTMTGVLEYAHDPAEVFHRLRTLAPLAIVTYTHGGRIRDRDWNDLTEHVFARHAAVAGWTVELADTWRGRGLRRQLIWRLT